MWFEELAPDASWTKLWSGYSFCGHCRGIRTVKGSCPACGAPPYDTTPRKIRLASGGEIEIAAAFAGAEGRYEDWVYLKMLEREWKRPLSDADRFLDISESHRPSPRAVVAIVFWTYFETRIERLLWQAIADLPPQIVEELLARHSCVGARLERLYKVLFDTNYWRDLADLGFEPVAGFLKDVQECRNRFTHGALPQSTISW
jgi:hypothetical protein